MEYRAAEAEADTVCAQLMRDGKAWGCMSNDMDMFAYGCLYILRDLNVDTHTVIYYNMKLILRELKLSMKLFREVVILSGTDYNPTNDTPLHESMRLARRYQEYVVHVQGCPYDKNNPTLSFYAWVEKNTWYIADSARLIRIYKMFA